MRGNKHNIGSLFLTCYKSTSSCLFHDIFTLRCKLMEWFLSEKFWVFWQRGKRTVVWTTCWFKSVASELDTLILLTFIHHWPIQMKTRSDFNRLGDDNSPTNYHFINFLYALPEFNIYFHLMPLRYTLENIIFHCHIIVGAGTTNLKISREDMFF